MDQDVIEAGGTQSKSKLNADSEVRISPQFA